MHNLLSLACTYFRMGNDTHSCLWRVRGRARARAHAWVMEMISAWLGIAGISFLIAHQTYSCIKQKEERHWFDLTEGDPVTCSQMFPITSKWCNTAPEHYFILGFNCVYVNILTTLNNAAGFTLKQSSLKNSILERICITYKETATFHFERLK